jgi:hypothetical protein
MPSKPSQMSLFEEPDSRALIVKGVISQGKAQDRQQGVFQKLIKQIHQYRMQIEGWQAFKLRHDQRVVAELMPVMAALREKRIALVQLLERQYLMRGAIRGKLQRKRLVGLMLDISRQILHEADEPTIQALHDRYSDLTYREHCEIDREISQNLIEEMFGVQLKGEGDDSEAFESVDEMLLKAAEQLQTKNEQAIQRKRSKPPSAAAHAAEQKRAEAERLAKQSVRDVYRKLASALHPDRPSEANSPEQKLLLMQRVNQAYEADNLLELLNIQLEIEQVDMEQVNSFTPERMQHYNHVLRQQLEDLRSEVEFHRAPYQQLVGVGYKFTPEDVELALDAEIRRQKDRVQWFSTEIEKLEDPQYVISAIRRYEPASGIEEFSEFNKLMDVWHMAGGFRQTRR